MAVSVMVHPYAAAQRKAATTREARAEILAANRELSGRGLRVLAFAARDLDDAVRVALDAGIDVRMITGDHTVTARAIADDLGLGPGVITGTELEHLPDSEVSKQAAKIVLTDENSTALVRAVDLGRDLTVVIGFIAGVPDPWVMQRPPRRPGSKIVNGPCRHPPRNWRATGRKWNTKK